MSRFKEGDWIRYTDQFCQETNTTAMGLKDMTERRGKVSLVFQDGELCNVDWGDHVLQHCMSSACVTMAQMEGGAI
jgi:hypothetical protein